MIVEPKEGFFKTNDKIILKCQTTLRSGYTGRSQNGQKRHQRANIHWYKDNELIRTTSLYRDKENVHRGARKFDIDVKQDENGSQLSSVLTINNAKAEDSGKYKCVYDNIHENANIKVLKECKYCFFQN